MTFIWIGAGFVGGFIAIQTALEILNHEKAKAMTDIIERLRTSTEWAHCKHSMREEAAAEIERLTTECNILHGEADMLRTEINLLRALLLRHQVAAWCEEDSDLAVETRRALEPKP